MYCQIIFSQSGSDTFEEAYALLHESGFTTIENISRTVDFLSQWDFGYESETEYSLQDTLDRKTGEDLYYDKNTGYIILESPISISLWRKTL